VRSFRNWRLGYQATFFPCAYILSFRLQSPEDRHRGAFRRWNGWKGTHRL